MRYYLIGVLMNKPGKFPDKLSVIQPTTEGKKCQNSSNIL